ncbi:hypothetical protein Tco_0755674 [Tanacetum coccineum]
MERELGAGYSFERKPCFVCGSLSHLIKDCDYYEKKMAREAALKSKKVVHADVRQATPAWTNTNRVNKANQFTPRPVQLSNIRPNLSTASNTIKTGRVNVNTGHGNVSSGRVYVNTGTQFKSGGSRFNTGHGNVNSGRVHVNTARVNRPILSNPDTQVNLKKGHLEIIKNCPKVDLLLWRSKGSISGKVISPSADHEEEVFSDADDEMPEIRIYDKSSEGIFEKASYDDEGIISDFNNLPDEVDVPTNPTLRIHNAHPQSQILGDPNTPGSDNNSLKKIMRLSSKSLEDEAGLKLCRKNSCSQASTMYGFWLNKPNGAKVIRYRNVIQNKKDERGVVVKNKARKSTTVVVNILGQRLISWQCKKQTIVATSTTEAEYVAAANCCGQVLWVQNQLLDYGFNFMNTKIHIDNERAQSCIFETKDQQQLNFEPTTLVQQQFAAATYSSFKFAKSGLQ